MKSKQPTTGKNDSSSEYPIIVIGSGPVGLRVVDEIFKREITAEVKLFGNEPWKPYDRVQLTSLLSGETSYASLFTELEVPDTAKLEQLDNCPIERVDTENKIAIDINGIEHPYRKIIFATGSKPHIPNIPGVDKKGVYTFRDMNDAQQLLARRVKSRTTIVIGGGLLGIEAARAMQRGNTKVILVEHGSHLMTNQLDEQAGEQLREFLMTMDIQILLGSGIKSVEGDDAVSGVTLRNGRTISCDTIVIATGIIPNIQLAKESGLQVARGIKVDDQMQTSHEGVYAVGECAEHRGSVYGLVAPGYEQAAVAAHAIIGGSSKYSGSIAATHLKVIDKKVFSMGAVNDITMLSNYQSYIFHDANQGIYRKIVVHNRRLVGSLAVGEWSELGRIQEAVQKRRYAWPWQLWKFEKSGNIWPANDAKSVADWPARSVVCNCTGVTRGELSSAMQLQKCKTVNELSKCTGAGTVCGSCVTHLSDLLGSEESIPQEPAKNALTIFGLVATLLAALFFFLSPIAPAESVNNATFEKLWSDGWWKQFTGYTILALSALIIAMSIRKRIKKVKLGHYAWWRLLHVITAMLAVIALLLHTGLSMGENLNYWLMMDFVALAIVGGVAAIVSSQEQRIGGAGARRLRAWVNWAHILVFWPLPVLLGFHVLTVYYY